MAAYVKNPNYNPLDPRSNRYVTTDEAQVQAGTKASTLNDLFKPFSAVTNATKFSPSNFYQPIDLSKFKGNAPVINQGQTAQNKTPLPAGMFPVANATNSTPLRAPTPVQTAPTTPRQVTPTAPTQVQTPVQQMAAAPVAPQGRLSDAEIADLANKAGQAGMATGDFLDILANNGAISSEESNTIRSKLGIPELVDETYKKPDKTMIDQYKGLYGMSGLDRVKDRISELDQTINKKREDLVKATGDINSNPWISQATRAGRLKNLQELAYADINNDLSMRDAYMDTYDTGVSEIERQIGYITTDQETNKELNVERLNYLLNEAERQQTTQQQDTITKGLRNVPEFLQGVLNREETEYQRELSKTLASKSGNSGGVNYNLLDIIQGGGGVEDIVLGSAGGKATTDGFRTSYEKTLNTLYQLTDLNEAFAAYKATGAGKGLFNSAEGELTGPFIGIIRSANPYDTKAQQIRAQLQAIVPNLARGVYGEVGVLTDADIANYSQTLPNLKSTTEVRNALLAITAKSVYRALENKLLVQAKGKVDVSGFASDISTLRQTTDNLLSSAGIQTAAKAQATGDIDGYLQSLGYGAN